jgi:hypothetical protein
VSVGYNIGPVFMVSIHGDRPLVLAFKEWAIASRIYSFGGGACGPDWMREYFNLKHQHEIALWFSMHGIDVATVFGHRAAELPELMEW